MRKEDQPTIAEIVESLNNEPEVTEAITDWITARECSFTEHSQAVADECFMERMEYLYSRAKNSFENQWS